MLYGENDYYFKGFTAEAGYTETSDIAFVVNFLDACRTSATISSLTIVYPISKVDESSYIILPAIQDSLDQGNIYEQTICGEKRFALSNPPSYLSVELPQGDESAIAPFKIVYNHLMSSELDVGVHTIDYTITFVDYLDERQPVYGSFLFIIEETCARTYLKEHETIKDFYTIKAFATRMASYKYQAYSDEVSDMMGQASACGDITYSIFDRDEDVILDDQAFVRVKGYPGASTFSIELDTR